MSEYKLEFKAGYGRARINLLNAKGFKCGYLDVKDGKLEVKDDLKEQMMSMIFDQYPIFAQLARDAPEMRSLRALDDLLDDGEDGSKKSKDGAPPNAISCRDVEPGLNIGKSIFSEENVQKGLIGEQRTAGVLSVVLNEPSARILNSVDLKTRDIDHVLFHRNGIFVINSKYRRSTEHVVKHFEELWRSKIIDDAREVASIASSLFSDTDVEIAELYKPVVAVWSEPSFEFKTVESKGATLIQANKLVDYIYDHDDQMDDDTCVALFELVRLKIDARQCAKKR